MTNRISYFYPNKRFRSSSITAMSNSTELSALLDAMSNTGSRTSTSTENNNSTTMSAHQSTFNAATIKVDSRNPDVKRTTKSHIDYRDQYHCEIAWGSNTQRFTVVAALGTKQQYLEDINQKNMAFSSYQNFFSLNPLQGIASGNFTPANSAPSTDWISINNGVVYMDFVNLSSLACVLKVHWFRCEEECNENVLSRYNSLIFDNRLYTTTHAVSGKFSFLSGNESIISGVSPTNDNFASILTFPYTNLLSKPIKTYTKVRTHTFALAAGSSYRLTQLMDLNMFASKAALTDQEEYLKGSLHCVIETQGVATHVPAVETGTAHPDMPILAPGKIGIVISRKLKLAPLRAPNDRFNTAYIANRNQVLGLGPTETSAFIDDDIVLGTGQEAP